MTRVPLMWKLVDPSCKTFLGLLPKLLHHTLQHFTLRCKLDTLTLSIMVQQQQNDTVISTDVWATPFTWYSVPAAIYGPLGNCQQHDAINQSPYCVQNQLNAMKWEVLKYQTYSSNLSPCVFDMFGLLKKTLMMDDDVDKAAIQCSRQQLKDFYTDLYIKTAPVWMAAVIFLTVATASLVSISEWVPTVQALCPYLSCTGCFHHHGTPNTKLWSSQCFILIW